MYGTVAQLRALPGLGEQLETLVRNPEFVAIPGLIATYGYRMDAGADEYYLAVIFDSKEAYAANAASPEQDKRYRTMRALLATDPVWHDGEIIVTHAAGT